MTLLLLAGTGEATRIATTLHAQGINAIATLAGATRAPRPLGLRTHIGGFGGEDGFRAFVANENITAVLDATHPFAQRITKRTARICADLTLPYCLLRRPEWTAGPGDLWTHLTREEDAADHITPGQTVFLATGRQTLHRFATLAHCTLICRQIDAPDGPFPFANGRFLVGRPPFSVAQETALFSDLAINWLIVKNAGGEASRTKLTAARNLGIRVAMIARPPAPNAPIVQTVPEALTWIAEQSKT